MTFFAQTLVSKGKLSDSILIFKDLVRAFGSPTQFEAVLRGSNATSEVEALMGLANMQILDNDVDASMKTYFLAMHTDYYKRLGGKGKVLTVV